MWHPITNVYSPPTYNHSCYVFALYDHEIQNIGKIIGKEGMHFKNITHLSGSSYIWFNQYTNYIEIWIPNPHHIDQVYIVFNMLICHIDKIFN